ncbi:fumarylacetoacetate hydrolase [Candidatus Pelagibacter communis]|uniref:fumarylacetoacetate hydrolase n=1 Tax=Pelagibacter ubique TaxID=198252 RepID=UPI00094DBA6B|nr:fumarylacetoacetate hydrolase [Candidatus Pelagibacter ubique]
MKKEIEKIADKLVNAYKKNNLINPIPIKYTKNIKNATRLRKLCESKIKTKVVGFKAGGTALPVLKKLKEKEPFYSAIFKNNVLKSGKGVKINKSTLGIEVEVGYLINKNFFNSKKVMTMKNISKYITHMMPCIEVVGYRQKKQGIKFLGDLASDFGANVKFLIGPKKKFKRVNIGNLKCDIKNVKTGNTVKGNTNSVYINPLNSLRFVLNKMRKDKVKLNTNFYVFTGSTVGVVPLKNKGMYIAKIDKIGTVKSSIR